MNKEILLQILETAYPPVIVRSEIDRLKPQFVSSGSMANEDSAGTGPEGMFYIGRKACYTRESYCKWLVARFRPKETSVSDGRGLPCGG